MTLEAYSTYTPRDGYGPPDPRWKSMSFVEDVFEHERRHERSSK
jgi:hypothetical protein